MNNSKTDTEYDKVIFNQKSNNFAPKDDEDLSISKRKFSKDIRPS